MRLIDADALQSAITEFREVEYCNGNYSTANGMAIAQTLCNKAPTIDAEPVVHGRWINERVRIKGYSVEYSYECSSCGSPSGYDYHPWRNYCPNCGAKMVLEEKE